jgi:hypothetical protein
MNSSSVDNFYRYLRFVFIVTLAHVVTYLVVGALAYNFVYEPSVNAGSFDQHLRNPQNIIEFRHVEFWLLPAQILRGLLFGLALCPFLNTLLSWSIQKRFFVLLGLLMVFSVWSVTMPGPGSIEGWLYLKPNYGPTLSNPLLGYIEVPVQLAIFSAMVSWRIEKLKKLTAFL